MSAPSLDLPDTAQTVLGRRDALAPSPSPAGPATDSPAGGKLPLSATERTRHRRFRHRGQADRDSLYAVLDAGLVAHLGVIIDGWPMVVPTCYGFTADTLYLHGSAASQSLHTASTPVCVTITLADGLVLGRSVFEHTINYRSAMIYGQPRLVTDPAERLAGLRIITEHVAPGQWGYARQPSRKDLAAVRLLALPLDEASVKIRTGPPTDGDSLDAALGLWAGELPLATTWQQPIPDPALPPGTPSPDTSVPAPARRPAGPGSGARNDRALLPPPGGDGGTGPRSGLTGTPKKKGCTDQHPNLAHGIFGDEDCPGDYQPPHYLAGQSSPAASYSNLIHYGEADKGGHFAALEQREILVSEIRTGMRTLRS
jgi:uncharacterized protein